MHSFDTKIAIDLRADNEELLRDSWPFVGREVWLGDYLPDTVTMDCSVNLRFELQFEVKM